MPPSPPYVTVVLQLLIMVACISLAILNWRLRRTQGEILRQAQEHLKQHEELNEQLRAHQVEHEARARRAQPMILRPPAPGRSDVS